MFCFVSFLRSVPCMLRSVNAIGLKSPYNCLLRRRGKRKRRLLGPLHTVPQTAFPRPRQGSFAPCTPSFKREEKVAGAPSHCPPDSVPQTPSGELRPLHPLFRR